MSKRPNRPLPLATPAGVEVLTKILTQGPIPRVEIARRTGLSQAAVTKAVAPLIETGFVTDQAAVPVELDNQLGIGRPVSPLTVVPSSVSVIGVKVTPTDLIGVTTDFTSGILSVRHEQLADTAPERVIAQLAELVKALIGSLKSGEAVAGPLVGVGVAVSGDGGGKHGLG